MTIVQFRSKERGSHKKAADVFEARKRQSENQNKMLIDRIKGMPAQPATPESNTDPQNPNRTGQAS